MLILMNPLTMSVNSSHSQNVYRSTITSTKLTSALAGNSNDPAFIMAMKFTKYYTKSINQLRMYLSPPGTSASDFLFGLSPNRMKVTQRKSAIESDPRMTTSSLFQRCNQKILPVQNVTATAATWLDKVIRNLPEMRTTEHKTSIGHRQKSCNA